ncbi:AAA family ATPase [Actinospica robiniae]|uniref:AAA family ATPase n=1 Tax=Actinospica robiniae TaxID=304901 RepID=UPI0004071FCC|nr:AAA family ATPase [Actinospica robiniae]
MTGSAAQLVTPAFILTGAPGAGKTAILRVLESRGHDVVEEAATAVIECELARGVRVPMDDPAVIERIAALQLTRWATAAQRPAKVRFFDRSPLCTLALARFMDYPVPAALGDEVERMRDERLYQPRVFLIRNQGTVKPTVARRISQNDAVRFERIHAEAYAEFGYTCVPVAPAPLDERALIVEREALGGH